MLVKYSYQNRKLRAQVIEAVGKPFNMWERLKMNGNGSQRLVITSANQEIEEIINKTGTSDPYINIELREKGIILHIRVRLDNWALVIPYHTLSIFSQDSQLNLYSGKWRLKLSGFRGTPVNMTFMHKALSLKAKRQAELPS